MTWVHRNKCAIAVQLLAEQFFFFLFCNVLFVAMSRMLSLRVSDGN
jgi:hypothetical protein